VSNATTVEEIAMAIREAQTIRIGAPNQFRLECPATQVELTLNHLDQILSFEPADQLVSVQSGITLIALNTFLRERGFEIPVGRRDEQQNETIADLLSFNLPHHSSSMLGSWRDWVVRMKIILASGEIVVSGANVVKNVAGFDLHKLMIGAKHTLGVPVEVTLRVRPFLGPKVYDCYETLTKPFMANDISFDEQRLMLRTKQIFDPTNKLNPGEFGFI
jgi:FAD/FMN-containing dehydrogenase